MVVCAKRAGQDGVMTSTHNPTDLSDEELADHLVESLPRGVFSTRDQWLSFLASGDEDYQKAAPLATAPVGHRARLSG